ncbi:DUF3572 domain-containing protein [Methylobrevis albus]|uniref:DUF3572 domain-containing protein n=1 Tax=Methylobrevis albus TaxID=2793297 RepID=A0A931HY49_9HYPH|nr:DUF3572 domain-containing protein [Methylobrevis albus]MBH0236582.1 DUF3572 domain-containing protein [Methylobrevis albus]
MRNKGHDRLNAADSEAIAIAALGHLAGDSEALGRFLALSGIGPADLRAAAQEPGFLVGVLEFFLEDETRLLAFAANEGLRPTMIAAARFALAAEIDDG